MPSSVSALSGSRFGGLLRDLKDGLRQQMFFWGRDVLHPQGNLLVSAGLEKTRSRGLQGTSCYGTDWRGGRIELHGACAGWYAPGGGVAFIRTLDRCVGWLPSAPPVPGAWPREHIEPLEPALLRERSLPFLDWWIAYEEEILRVHGPDYRDRCFREFKALPGSKPWLPPTEALRWLRAFREHPAALVRAKHFAVRSAPGRRLRKPASSPRLRL